MTRGRRIERRKSGLPRATTSLAACSMIRVLRNCSPQAQELRADTLDSRNEGGEDEATLKQLLLKALHRFTHSPPVATCQSGYGAVCKTVYPGSIPGVASNKINELRWRLRAPKIFVSDPSAD